MIFLAISKKSLLCLFVDSWYFPGILLLQRGYAHGIFFCVLPKDSLIKMLTFQNLKSIISPKVI
jgi:hypothetical protein